MNKRNLMWTGIVVLAILLIGGGIGYYFYYTSYSKEETRAFEIAMGTTEPAILQNYLDEYGNAPQAHRDAIMARLKSVGSADEEWAEALKRNSQAIFMKFIERYPDNVHVPDAKLHIDSLDYVQAVRTSTPEAMKDYMLHHPNGMYFDYARLKCDSLEIVKERLRKEAIRDSILRANGESDSLLLDM